MGQQLWRTGLDWLYEANGDGVHPLDRARARRLGGALRLAGEKRPATDQLASRLNTLWPSSPGARAMTRKCLGNAHRAQSAFPRGDRGECVYLLELLIARRGGNLTSEALLERRMRGAVREFLATTARDDGTHAMAEADLADVNRAVRWLAEIRSGRYFDR